MNHVMPMTIADDDSMSLGAAEFDFHQHQEPFGPSSSSTSSSAGQGGSDQLYAVADSQTQCIRFVPFQPDTWGTLVDALGAPVPLHFQVDADKGFNYSNSDDSYVVQKKNQ